MDFITAWDFIVEHGIKQKQNEDMTYGPREDSMFFSSPHVIQYIVYARQIAYLPG